MRSYSHFLNYLKTQDPEVKFHLGGSTPPIPPFLAKKSVKVSLNPQNYMSDLVKTKKTLAKKIGCLDSEITFVPGSTIAATHVLAALTEPGDTVILEKPIYEPYVATAEFLGLKVLRFQRTNHFERDLGELKELAPKAKLILISNPHCPTAWFYEPQKMQALNQLGTRVVIDEVFLPLLTKGEISHKKYFPEWENVVFISGLSKSTGLGFHRCGWIVAPHEETKKIQQIALHFQADFPMANIPVMDFALKNWMPIISGIQKIFSQNKKLIQKFDREHPGYLENDFEKTFFGMLKVPPEFSSGEEFVQALQQKGILLRDGAFFEMPEHVRFHSVVPAKTFAKIFKEITSNY